MALIECVPNVSVGNNPAVLAALVAQWQAIPGFKILHIDASLAANRTVLTGAGEPSVVLEALFALFKACAELIDMRQHHGIHPRIGACDVCPLIPLEGCSMEEAVNWAHQLGTRIGQELNLAGYYYAAAALRPERQRLADLRRGEYESLATRQGGPAWQPDFGPAEFNPRFGLAAIGARPPLVAYNIHLNTPNTLLAKEIAGLIRTSGRHAMAEQQNGGDGESQQGGKFSHLQAIGWWANDLGTAQVSTNVLDYEQNSLADIYQEVQRLALAQGAQVTGSEIVGLVPRAALVQSGQAFLKAQHAYPVAAPQDLLNLAVESLGLRAKNRWQGRKILEDALAMPLNAAEINQLIYASSSSSSSYDYIRTTQTSVKIGLTGLAPARSELAAVFKSGEAAVQILLQLCQQAFQAYQDEDPHERPPETSLIEYGEKLLAWQQWMQTTFLETRPTAIVAQGMSFLDQAQEMMDIIEGLLVLALDGQKAFLGQSLYLLAAAIEGAALVILAKIQTMTDKAFQENIGRELDVILDNFRQRFYPAVQNVQS